MVRDIFFPLRNLPIRAIDSLAQGRVQHSPDSSTIERPSPSPNVVLTRPIECATERLRVLLRPTRLSLKGPPASRVPPPPEGHPRAPKGTQGHRIGAQKRRTW